MATMQISGEKLVQVRRFTIDVLRYSKKPQDSVALALFRRYKENDIPQLAENYAKNLNGSCPKAKERITNAVNKFLSMQGFVENVLLSGSKNNDLAGGDFLPLGRVSGIVEVKLY